MKAYNILHLEDSKTDADLVKRIITNAGIECNFYLADTREEFIQGLEEFKPDMILSDHTLPSFNSKRAFAIAKEKYPEILFLLVTGTVSEEFAVDMIKNGVDDYLLKSNLQRLPIAITNAFARKANEEKIKAMQWELQQSELHLRSIFDNTEQGIILLDKNYKILEINHRTNYYVTLFFGIELKKNDNLLSLNMDEGKQQFIKTFARVLTGEAVSYATEYHVEDGQKKYFDVKLFPVFDPSGKITGGCINFQDITKQKRGDEERKKLAERLQLATTSAKMGIWDWDLNSNILVWDEEMYNLYGIVANEFNSLYDEWLIRLYNEDRERVDKEVQLAITNKKDYDTEFRIVWGDSTILYIRATGIVERDNNGKALRMIGANWDVTKEKQTAIALEKSEKEFRSLAESMPQIVWTTRADGWNTYFNQNWRDYTGLTLEESSGHGWNKPFHPDDQQRAWDTWQNAVQNKGEYCLECRLRKHDGTYRWWLVRGIPHIGDNGEILKWFGTCTDIDQIKHSEELVKKEKALSDSVINSLPGVFYLFDVTGKFLRWNKEFELITGYSAQEIATMKTGHFFKDDEQTLISKSISEAFSEGASNVEAHFLTKDNREIPFYLTSTLTSYGEKACLVGVGVDISERKNAEKERKSLINSLVLATTSAGMGIWDWNIKNNELLWDEKMCKLYGIVAADFSSLYDGWFLRLHEEEQARVDQEIQLAITNKKDYDTEFRVVWSDSSIHYIRSTGMVERDNYGKAQRMIGANWDVTAEKEKEQHLKLLESVITHTNDSVLITEAEPFDEPGQRIVFVNEAFTKMTGYTSEEIIGKTPKILQGPKSDKTALKRFSEDIRKWKSCEVTTVNYKKNGEEYWVNFSVSPVASEKGCYTHWISIERDVTTQKLAEIQLNELNKNLQYNVNKLAISNEELEQFAYVASHDLQEPLRMITSFLGKIEQKYDGILDEKGKQYIHFAVDGAVRMRQIIHDLLEFSRVSKNDEQLEEIDLNVLVDGVRRLLSNQIVEKKAVFEIGKLPTLAFYKSPLVQIFQNLISNALKYTKADVSPRISLACKENESNWEFSIADNGIGISEEYFDKVFILFQRLHNKNEYSGTGIGLAITKKIIEKHGGKIWVESDEGKGSTFYFTIKKQIA